MKVAERIQRLKIVLEGLDNFKKEPEDVTSASRGLSMLAALESEVRGLLADSGEAVSPKLAPVTPIYSIASNKKSA